MKTSLWKIGLILLITAPLINGLLIQQNIGGLVREFMRLVILIGIAVFVAGLIQIHRSKS